ncbi:unnamed protein product (macronuclear) [Paramecium tetraurelia]|uniref:HIT-type domain-containing protein n=1 Tax=Paramecium tetraurelia TaxID=5888 RepID=A0C0U3_PARTE|nr:uncharacterized protein GSPATT00033886001 [Paramecium tetraurelia]CAK64410.1 unnamed protein product [Paramecium tetraurelia]|eukprot:XP_001431808.1 hypothetical protein (macronuclear) [Paramecium tetraurelia strain d4-2]
MATTRNQKRTKTYTYVRNIDENQRSLRTQSKLDILESDYYDSPNKLAEEELSDASANRKKSKMLRIAKKKQNNTLRKNVNLKKMLKNTPLDSEFLNFQNITPKAKPQQTKQCSICRSQAKYTCPRCLERYCSLDCHQTHKEIQCLRMDY